MSLDHTLLHQRPRYPGLVNSDLFTFYPLQVSDLLFWFDAQAITGKNDGDSVTQWDDLSGNAYHATEATYPPTYKTNVINGKVGLQFAIATSTKLTIPTTTHTYLSIFIVVNVISKSVSFPVVYQEETINTGVVILNNNGTVWSYRYGNATFPGTGATYVSGQPNIISMILGSGNIAYYDAAVVSTSTVLYGTSRTKAHTIGGNVSAGNQFNGYIGELIAYNRVLTTEEIADVHRYLETRWGI